MSKEIKEVKQNLNSKSEQERLAALSETLNYGQEGLELLIEQSLKDSSEKIKQSAYWVLHGDNPYLNGNPQKTCPTDTITSLAISSDNTFLVGGNWQKIWVWKLQSGEIVRTLEGHSHWVLSVAISPDGNTLVSGSADKTIKVWNLKTGQLIRTLSGHSSWVTTVVITPDGKTIVSGSADKTIKIWDLNTGKLSKTFKNEKVVSSILSLYISSDGKLIASGSTNNKINLWSLDGGQVIRSLEGHSDWIQSLTITSNNTTLISGSRDGAVKFWQSKAGEQASNESSSIVGKGLVDIAATAAGFLGGGPIVGIGVWAVGRLIVNAVDKGNFYMLPVQKLECTKTFSHQGAINSLAYHANQNIIVVGFSQNIKIYDFQTNRIIYALQEQPGFISSVAVSYDGKILAFAGKDWVTLLDARTGKTLHPIKGCSYSKLSKLIILESPQELLYGQSKHFTVKGLDQNSKEMNLKNKDIKWETTGGKIEQGLFTAGQYEGKFEVKAKIGIFEASIPITIVEPPRITEFSVTPSSITLEFGKTQQFIAKILDQRGNPMPKTVLWEVNGGGTIDRKGKFIAGSTQGKFEIIASVSSIRRVIPITIIEPPKLREIIITSSISQLEFGRSFQFQVKGVDQYGNNIPTGKITWSASSGKIDKEGKFYAGEREETVTINATVGAIIAWSEIKVCEPSRLTVIEIVPSSVILKPGQSRSFNVLALNQRGEQIAVRNIEWNATDGLINQDGYFCSGEQQKGYCQVTVNIENLSASAEVFVIPVLKEIKIYPEEVELKPEEEFTFSISGLDQVGEPIEIKNVIWTTTTGGSIAYTGIFRGDYKKREVTVTAKAENLSATAKVILLPVLRRLEIQPSFVYLKPSEQQTFIVKGFDQFGSEIEPGDIYWETTGGKISQDGTLSFEQSEQGYFQVTATSQLAPKHSQNVKTLLLYTGISSIIIYYLISYETILQELFALDSGLTATEEELDNSRIDETQPDTEITQHIDTVAVETEEQVDVEQTTETETIVDTKVLDFSVALEQWLFKKLRKLVAKVFLSISRFCLSEASANLSASADVFVLDIKHNPYKNFKCVKVFNNHSGFVDSLAVTPDGQKLISGSWDDTIKIWDLHKEELINTLKDHTSDVECVAITPDGQTLVSAGWDKTIKIWDLKTSELLNSIPCSNSVVLVAITSDGKNLISSETYNIINLWNLDTQERKNKWVTYSADNHPFWWHKCIVISPDQKRIIVGTKIIKSYDLITRKLVTIIGTNLGWVYALAITPDGKTLISSHDKIIKIWDLTANKYPIVRLTLKSFTEKVYALTLTPDSKRLISAGCKINEDYENEDYENDDYEDDGYESLIEIWDLDTGEQLHSIKEYTTRNNNVYCLTITPDGKKLLSGYRDGTIKIWGIPDFTLG